MKVDSPSKSGWPRTIVDDHGSNRTVNRVKVDGLNESKNMSGQSKNVKIGRLKVGGLKVPKWTAQMY